MAACAFSTLCVGRHATARTRSLASQWSSSSSRPGGALRPPSTTMNITQQPMAIGGFATTPSSTVEFSTAALQRVAAASSKQQGVNDGDTTASWEFAAMTSLFALAAASSSIATSNGPSSTTRTSAEAPPKPLATSAKFASPSLPFVQSLTEASASLSSSTSESSIATTSAAASTSTVSRPKVQIRRTVRRRYGSFKEPFAMHDASHLPARFHFYQNAAECEGAAYQEVQKKDILIGSKRYEVSVEAFQGRRESMEDEVVVNGGGRFAAVFDGHGGGDVSMYLKQHLYHLFLLHLEQKHWEESDSDVEDIRLKTPSIPAYMAALRQALHSVETEVIRHSELNFVGSTAVAVVLHENPGGYRTLISANVGDSRAILSRNGKAVELTKDHKPTAEGERKRILRAGGRIFLDDTGVHRVMNLSLSRAIGDGFSKPIVSPEPDIRRFRVEDGGDEFILLASDGLWDVMSSQDAVNFVTARLAEAKAGNARMSEEDRAKKLTEARRSMSDIIVQEAMRIGSADNTSVVMVWLQNDPNNA